MFRVQDEKLKNCDQISHSGGEGLNQGYGAGNKGLIIP